MSDDARAADALDRFLDGLAQGRRPPQPTLDENLARFARRVQATTIAPPPRPAFGRDLRRSLLTESAVVPAPTGRIRRMARRLPRPTHDAPMSRWRPAVEFAVMVCLIVAVFGGIRAGDRLWPIFATPDDGQYIVVRDTTPAPVSPDEDATCQTPPRTFEEIEALAATPVADLFDPIADSGGTRAELESVHEILRTLEQIQACAADGDLLAVYANFSDRFIRRHLGPAATADTRAFQEAMADPPLVRWPPAEEYVSIDDLVQPRGKLVLVDPNASLLNDGRVRAVVGIWRPTNEYLGQYVVFFASGGDRWLIDEVFETELFAAVDVIAPVEGGLRQDATAVTVEQTALRGLPSGGARVVAVVPAGTTLVVRGPSRLVAGDEWWPVLEPVSGHHGYVLASAIESSPPRIVILATPAAPSD